MKNRSLKAGGRLNRWPFKAGFTLILEAASEVLPSIENLSALPERRARGAAEGTTRGQCAKVSMRGGTEDAASNWLRIFPKQTFYRVFENIQMIHLGFQFCKLFMGPYKKKRNQDK